MSDLIDQMFGENEEGEPEVSLNYPGSKRRIRWQGHDTTSGGRILPPSDPIFNKENWGKPTPIEVIPGEVYLFYRPNIMAKILGKSVPTLKFWEQSGFVPKPPFRFRYNTTVRNYYNEDVILALLALLNQRGLLTADRIEWAQHPDLPDQIRKEWSRIRDEWMEEIKRSRVKEV